MKSQSFTIWGAVLLLITLLCIGQAAYAQEGASAQADPYLTPEIAPNVDRSVMEQRSVTLYFRMQGENMLATETRTVNLPKDKRVEMVLVESLLSGPSPGILELSGLFNSDVSVVRVWDNENTLMVMLNRAFLSPPPNAPEMWENDVMWRNEVYTRRQLGLASIVNTITDATNYTAVQFVIAENDDDGTGRRLLRSEIYPDVSGSQLLEPVLRSEQFILTHYYTANVILYSWRERSFDRIFRFVAQEIAQRPTDAAFLDEMAYSDKPLIRYAVSPGAVSEDGQTAVLEVQYMYMINGEEILVNYYPMRLVRENGIWKITYEDLLRMMEAQ